LTFHAGQALAFRLRANPTAKREGKRFGLMTEGLQRAWLERKGAAAGFRPSLFQVACEGMANGHKGENTLTHLAVRFDGVLTVIDGDAFSAAIENGIGPAKAFGFGLLSVAPGGN
jgi:CRISPR system Cascade subunit CasE